MRWRGRRLFATGAPGGSFRRLTLRSATGTMQRIVPTLAPVLGAEAFDGRARWKDSGRRSCGAGCAQDGPAPRKSESGMLVADLIVAMAILVVAILPLALSFGGEAKVLRQSYQKAAAMELIDGEMEILLAGEWRVFHEGEQAYELKGEAAKGLPPGKAVLTINGKKLRLEWRTEKGELASGVVREGVVR